MHKKPPCRIVLLVSAVLIIVIAMTGCETEQAEQHEEPDQPLEIKLDQLATEPLHPGQDSQLSLSFKEEMDPEVSVSYAWTAKAGKILKDDEQEITWTAPEETGIYDISVAVETETGRSAEKSFPVFVGTVIEIVDPVLDPVDEGNKVDLTAMLNNKVEIDEDLYVSWEAEQGEIDNETSTQATWHAPETSGAYELSISVNNGYGQKASDRHIFLVGDEEGLYFNHKLSLEGDASQNPEMQLMIRNINDDTLSLDVIGTIYGNSSCIVGPDVRLFDFIDYDSLVFKTPDGEELDYDRQGHRINREQLDGYYYDEFFNFDVLDVNIAGHNTVIAEYELVSNIELMEGFGTNMNHLGGHYDDPEHFWAAFMEWFILRPREQQTFEIIENTMEITLPEGWRYAAVYEEVAEDKIDLGEFDFMHWDNEDAWKNIQRSPFILFKDGPFLMAKKEVAGTVLKDVYSVAYEPERNHEANYQFHEYLAEKIGELPVDTVLTIEYPFARQGGNSIEYLESYKRAPYGYGYSTTGQIWASGGADLDHGGAKMDEPQRWCIERFPDDEVNHLPGMWGTTRLWFGTIIKAHHIDPGMVVYYADLAVASYYDDWDVIENRFKPMYEFYLENVVQPDGTEVDVHAYTGHQFLTYFKPALGFYYLDKRIKEETGGEKDLSIAANYIFEKELQGSGLGPDHQVHYETLVDALYYTVEEGIDFETKAQGYIYGDRFGQKFLDLSEEFDIDLDEYLD